MTRRVRLGHGLLVIAVLALWTSGWTAPLALDLLDAEYRALRRLRHSEPPQRVTLVGIDEATTAAFAEPMALWHPHYRAMLEALALLRPKAVGLDVVLPSRSYDSVVPGYDLQLVRGLIAASRAFPLVLGVTLDADGGARPILPVFLAAAGEGASGFVLWPSDPDSVIRRFDERLARDGTAVPTLVGQIARRLGRDPQPGFIDFSIGAPFEYIPLHRLVQAYRSAELDPLRAQVEDSIVLVGSVMRLEDRKLQPVVLMAGQQGHKDAPGLLLHAQALRSIFAAGLVQPAPPGVSLALALAATLLWLVPMTPLRAVLLVLLPGVALLGASLWLTGRGVFLDVTLPLSAVLLTVLARGLYETAGRVRQRRQLRAALAGYFSPQIMHEVLEGRLSASLQGRRYLIAVMFADIRGFTPRSETLDPEALVRILNRYFEEAVACVHERGGTVDKFLGDGMMAFFGAPNALPDPARACLSAAKELFARVAALNRQLAAENELPIEIGIGLNVGQAVVGHVGARSRHEYTAIGDTVNVAARMEGLTNNTSYPLVCSAAVARAVGEDAGLVALGELPVKGHSPMAVYGWRPDNAGVMVAGGVVGHAP
jgi:class 3 adenylate cyclase